MAGCLWNTQAAAAEKEKEKGADAALEAYFRASLEGHAAPLSRDAALSAKNVKKWQQRVWAAYRGAYRATAPYRLPQLGSLSEERHSCWQLPDSLEPHAALNFFWGSKGAMPEGGYPLFVYLHGSGPRDREWATGMVLAHRFDDAPSAYFIPQIPNEGEYYRWWQRAKLYAWDHLLRLALLSDSIDADRLYLFGISEGGYGSQRLASYLADYLAAAGPMAGGEPLRNAPPENLANVPFSFLTGELDQMFYRNHFTPQARAALDSLQAAHPGHYAHRVELVPGQGHNFDYRPTTPWMSQYRRNPYPRFFQWENLEMDGCKRHGFYNVYLPDAPAADGPRTFFEVRIEGNEVDITASTVSYETTRRDSIWGIELESRKTLAPLPHGKLDVYLCDSLVNLSQRVTIRVNGQRVFQGKAKPSLRSLAESCLRYGDPRRLYPAAVRVEW